MPKVNKTLCLPLLTLPFKYLRHFKYFKYFRHFRHLRHFNYLTVLLLSICAPDPAQAYIGPGAGFALVSSFFILIMAGVLAAFTILTLPVRTVYLFFRRRKIRRNMKARRVIVVGFDGMDPGLCTQYMAEGKLPNLARLRDQGTFLPLKTSTPGISPVAWSSFATGVNPGKHQIFDFFTRDPRNYQPVLSSALIFSRKKIRAFGPFKFPTVKTTVKLLRKSTAFWKILGKSKIFSTILRVPITFPPEKFYGTCLAAMCAPDLRGTQGSFTLFTSEPDGGRHSQSKGTIIPLQLNNNRFTCEIPGPSIDNPGGNQPLTVVMTGELKPDSQTVCITLHDEQLSLQPGTYSPWLKIIFQLGLRKKIYGIARLLVTEIEPHLKIYLTPINIDPEHPSLPITHPFYYSICLAKLHGPFSTLGLSEDTWALNEGVIDEQAFLTQAYDICEERERTFLDNLRKSREGLLVSVFDTTDRIQHMFFRYLDQNHPANAGKDFELHKNAIADVYERSDRLVGEVLAEIDDQDLLLVISDHGFKQFQWGINLNTWLWKEGYLVLNEGAQPGAAWFAEVDWSKTRAYAFGLAGIFINTAGREKAGIIKPGREQQALLAELRVKLLNLHDENRRRKPMSRVLLATEELHGPYVKDAPDLFPGFADGYRVSWNSATGTITNEIFEPNTKRWSGDHCVDPQLVPGVLFSNWRIDCEAPALIDMAPTILDVFGLPKPRFQDGVVLPLEVP